MTSGKESDFTSSMQLLVGRTKPITNNVILDLIKHSSRNRDQTTGKQLFSLVMNNRHCAPTILFDNLIRMFANFGKLTEAKIAFQSVEKPSIYTWNAIISAHVNLGADVEALGLYNQMKENGMEADQVTFLCILKACGELELLCWCMIIHENIIEDGLESDLTLGNALVHMYCKHGVVHEARRVFDTLERRDVVTWGAMIAGYIQHGHATYAFDCFTAMQKLILPNAFIYSSVLKACSVSGRLEQGMSIHSLCVMRGLKADVVVQNSLINMYIKCGTLEDAKRIFDMSQNRDVVSWAAIIAGYAVRGPVDRAFRLFLDMQREGVPPCKTTFLAISKACASGALVENSMIVHDLIIRADLQSDVVISNTLIDMYAKCGALEEAHEVFSHLQQPTVVSWGAIIAGYVTNGYCSYAMKLFEKMNSMCVDIGSSILTCMLKTCIHLQHLRDGKHIYSLMIERSLESSTVGGLLIDVFTKGGSFEDADNVFKNYKENVESWAAIISGYSEHGYYDKVLELYETMHGWNIKPNNVVISSFLKACISLGDICKAKVVHNNLILSGMEEDIIIGNSLVYMYAKFGLIEAASNVFSALLNPDCVSWGAIMTGYVEHGYDITTLESLENLYLQGINPNEASFVSSLKACGNVGAREQGLLIHDQIVRNGLESRLAIGNSVLDMYGKCGRQTEAYEVFNTLPHRDVVAWGALITGYALNGYGKLAMQAFRNMQLQGLQPDDVLFTNILAACGQAGLVEEGCFYLRFAIQSYGMTPIVEQYGCMIDLLGRSGCMLEAEDMHQTTPVPPDIVNWLTLLTSCRTYGNGDKGQMYYKEIA